MILEMLQKNFLMDSIIMKKKLTHFDENDNVNMVDVSHKNSSKRSATARATVLLNKETLSRIIENNIKKGNVVSLAQFAGIMGAKKTAELIPLCHPLNLNSINIEIKHDINNCSIDILAHATIDAKTGVEMEVLTGVSIAALTIYDMCKSIDREIKITDIKLIEKKGGKSGNYKIEND